MNFINPNYRLKGCTNKYINDLAKKQFYNGLDISKSIDDKTYEIVSNYNVKECIKIILCNGDFYDAFIRCNNNYPIKLLKDYDDINNHQNNNNVIRDTILFHREMAFSYIKELIIIKINNRIDEILNYEKIINNENIDKTCSICLELVNNSKDDNWFISKCNHLFHKKCISKWTRNTCPLCRKRNYK